MPARPFALGRARRARSDDPPAPFDLPSHHLVTHGVVVGMTGSGKTGLVLGLVEEALRSRVPVLLLDVKGDLPNLSLLFDELDASAFAPWIDADAARREGTTPEAVAEATAARWREGLASWGLGAPDVKSLRQAIALRVITPGTSSGGEALNVLSALESNGAAAWDEDEEAARESLSASLSLLLRMVERDPDPTKSQEHVLLAHLAERRARAGAPSSLEALLADLQELPIERIGALAVDDFLPKKEREALARDLNALVASPTFASWRQGAPLDVASWMRGAPGDARVPATIVSVAHLEDEERMLVLSLVLEQALAWVRGLSGTTDLRALVLFDEIFGFLPPHPANPPTKRPLLALLKQARAFGVGCVLATQNPIDLDYKALSNAGVWFVGRLQTDADRERVVEGLAGSDAGAGEALEPSELAEIIKQLPPRTFFVRDVHGGAGGKGTRLLETRWTLSWLRGPMTRQEIRRWARASLPARTPAAPAPPPVASPAPAADAPVAATTAAPLPATAPSPAPAGAPSLPDGWRSIFPCAPEAPVDAWTYAPHAAIVARADVVDTKLGYRETKRVAVLVPIDASGFDVAKAALFEPDVFRHAPVAGARFAPLGDAFKGARATKTKEKTLRELALEATRTRVLYNGTLDLVSAPGESEQAFVERCQRTAQARAAEERASLVAKHDPKIQKLAVARDAARAAVERAAPGLGGLAGAAVALATGRGVGRAFEQSARADAKVARAHEKLAAAEAALAEAVAKRNADIHARESELAQAGAATIAKELRAKADALLVESYAVAWVAA